MDKNIYTIPTAAMEKIEKAIARITKKADRYGKCFSVEFGKPYGKERDILEKDEYGVYHKVGSELIEVCDVEIESETIVKNGYTVVAKLEHLEGGNVVRAFGENEILPEWRTLKARCEHCGGNHGQKFTFIVRHEDGTEKQVGRTCLKDYCGIDPQHIGLFNELQDLLLSDDFDSYDFIGNPVPKAYDSLKVLALATRVLKKQGYIKSDDRGSNKQVLSFLVNDRAEPTEDELTEARKIREAVSEIDEQTARLNLLDNAKTLLDCGCCKASHFGFLAYAPVAYERYIEKVEKGKKIAAEREIEAAGSKHVGNVGDKVEINIASMRLVTSWENAYGMTYLYKILDQLGNVFIWFASRGVRGTDDAKVLKGTVKDHTERDGVQQTVLTRCKIA